MPKEKFITKVQSQHKITIVKEIREYLDIEIGDIVQFIILPNHEVKIFKVKLSKEEY